ncbi:MAG: hypothetical protein AAGA28_09695 [Pseudomonadota bacterium]
MSNWGVLVLIAVSLAGLGCLMRTDPKRRRTHRLHRIEHRPLLWPARAAVFGPGLVFVAIGHWSGLVVWAGAVTVLGWSMAALSPGTYSRGADCLKSALRRGKAATASRLAGRSSGLRVLAERTVQFAGWASGRIAMPRKARDGGSDEVIATLKARIVALEARLERLERDRSRREHETWDEPEPGIKPAKAAK